jgi:DNA polymerase III delta subunit
MAEEFYGVNLFGERVDVGLVEPEEKEVIDKAGREFNIFPLTDAIGERDKRKAWVVYEQALASGMVADEIFWRVMWGVKALLLSAKTASAEESGLNPFVYRKFKSCLKNWKLEELEKLSESLVVGYHDARRGKGEMETMIEKILLTL